MPFSFTVYERALLASEWTSHPGRIRPGQGPWILSIYGRDCSYHSSSLKSVIAGKYFDTEGSFLEFALAL
jgi:hypothetical protein